MDPLLVDFDTLHEKLTTEAKDLLSNSLRDSFKGFLVALQESQSPQNGNNDPFNTRVAEFGRCPPPKLASLAAFDDLVIKLLGDCGGCDESLWRFAEKLQHLQGAEAPTFSAQPPDDSQVESTDQTLEIGTTNEEKYSDDRQKSQETSPRGNPDDGRDLASSPLESAAGDSSQPEGSAASAEESLAALLNRFWPSVVAATNDLRPEPTANLEEGASRLYSPVPPGVSRATDTASALLQAHPEVLAQANAEVNVALGKRGRYFLDVWEEEEFLQRYKPKAKLRSLRSWEDLFQAGYSDNHDGCYRDWLLGQQQDTKSRLQGSKVGRRKRQCDPIFRSAIMEPYDKTGLKRIVAPPVPVAIHHPAAWGIRGTASASVVPGKALDSHLVHPASVRSAPIVQAQHQKYLPPKVLDSKTAYRGGKGGGDDTPYTDYKAAKRKYAALTASANKAGRESPPAAEETGIEDIDDFNLYAAKLTRQLQLEEAGNFVRLARLQDVLGKHSKVDELARRREKLERLVYKAVQRMEPTSSDRVVYAYKPTKVHANVQANARVRAAAAAVGAAAGAEEESVVRLDVQGNVLQRASSETANGVPAGQSRYNTRCINSESIVAALRPFDLSANMRRELLGASAMRHVLQGALLVHCLVVDAEIEVCIDRRWQVATITKIVYDGDHARHIKVVPEDCTPLESVWLAVEDGRIAPCGTHLRPIKQPHLGAASSTSKASMVISPRPSAEDLQAPSALGGSEAGLVTVAVAGTTTGASKSHTVTPEETAPEADRGPGRVAVQAVSAMAVQAGLTAGWPLQANARWSGSDSALAQLALAAGASAFHRPEKGHSATGPSSLAPSATSKPEPLRAQPPSSITLLQDPRLRKILANHAAANRHPVPAEATARPDRAEELAADLSLRERPIPRNGAYAPNGLTPTPAVRIPPPAERLPPPAPGGETRAPIRAGAGGYMPLPYGYGYGLQGANPYGATGITYVAQHGAPPGASMAMALGQQAYVPYECEPETDPRQQNMYCAPGMEVPHVLVPLPGLAPAPSLQHRPVTTSVYGPPQPRRSLIPAEAYELPSNISDSSSGRSGNATGTGTFWLGPRGSIVKN